MKFMEDRDKHVVGAVALYLFLSLIEYLNPIGWTYPMMMIISIMVYCYLRLLDKMEKLSQDVQKLDNKTENE